MGKLRLALMDMYKGEENLGMRSLKELIETFNNEVTYDVFEIRLKNQIPGADYDIYISTGGPGSPNVGDGPWEKPYFNLLDELWQINQMPGQSRKHALFICHSFQLACIHFGLGVAKERRSPSFGVYPVYKTKEGESDPILAPLQNPYMVMDSREWQMVGPNHTKVTRHRAKILSLEKARPHVDLERAGMAMRFSREWLGAQFHPEANPVEAKEHFHRKEVRVKVVGMYGEKKYQKLLKGLEQHESLQQTWEAIVPGFVRNAISELTVEKMPT